MQNMLRQDYDTGEYKSVVEDKQLFVSYTVYTEYEHHQKWYCKRFLFVSKLHLVVESKKMSNDQELIQSDPTSCPQNQKGNN